MMLVRLPLILILWGISLGVQAVAISSNLPYPKNRPSALEIAQQTYFVNHFFGVRNIRYGNKKKPMVLMHQAPDGQRKSFSLERHLNNDYQDSEIRAKDLVIFRSGKLRGTGILVEDYLDPQRSLTFRLWLPAIRKIRRHAEPNQAEVWGGGVFTFGDIYLRRPDDESHQLLGEEVFKDCLEHLVTAKPLRGRYFRKLPDADCSAKGKLTYKLKSTTRFQNWWYDYRIVWIDQETFADYRADYYKESKLVKRIDKSWQSMALEDPRSLYTTYWYGRLVDGGHEAIAFIDPKQIEWNQQVDPGLWSEKTLRKIKR